MRAEFVAFKSRLEGHTVLSGNVYTSIRLTSQGEPVRDNYLVVYPSMPGRLSDDRYTAVPRAGSARTLTYDCRAVATSSGGVLVWADAAVTQLVGHRLTVSGRVCDPIRLVEEVEGGRVEYDRSVALFYMDFSFRFTSRGS